MRDGRTDGRSEPHANTAPTTTWLCGGIKIIFFPKIVFSVCVLFGWAPIMAVTTWQVYRTEPAIWIEQREWTLRKSITTSHGKLNYVSESGKTITLFEGHTRYRPPNDLFVSMQKRLNNIRSGCSHTELTLSRVSKIAHVHCSICAHPIQWDEFNIIWKGTNSFSG